MVHIELKAEILIIQKMKYSKNVTQSITIYNILLILPVRTSTGLTQPGSTPQRPQMSRLFKAM